MAYTILNNTPAAGQIQWAGLHIQYKGVSYTIVDGYTNAVYTYWSPAYPTNLVVTNTYPTLTADDCLLFLNKSGSAINVLTATAIQGDLIVPGTILTDKIAANAITADKIATGAVTANSILAGSISANAIAAGAIGADKIAAAVITGDKLVAATITGDKIAANTITANNILADSITAAEINVATLSSISANLGTVTAGTIQSLNYVVNTTGLKIVLDTGVWDSKYFKLSSTGIVSITGGSIAITTSADATSVIQLNGPNLVSKQMPGQLSVQNATTNEGVVIQGKGLWVKGTTGADAIGLGTDGHIWTIGDLNVAKEIYWKGYVVGMSAYPIGAIYMTTKNTLADQPATIFGGSWTRNSGAYLYAGNSGGGQFGSDTTSATAISQATMPFHNHGMKSPGWASGSPTGWEWEVQYTSGDSSWPYTPWTLNTDGSGGGQGHTHQATPYAMQLFVWQRTG